jgi:hypothetical protein
MDSIAMAFSAPSRRFSYRQLKIQELATFGWRRPPRNLAETLWNIEFDYLCHTSSSEALVLLSTTRESTPDAKAFLEEEPKSRGRESVEEK